MFKYLFHPLTFFEDAFAQKCNSIKNTFYKKLLKNLNSICEDQIDSNLTTIYNLACDLSIIHIKDDELAKLIYLKSQTDYAPSDAYETDTYSAFDNEIIDIKYVTLNNKEQVVFVICNTLSSREVSLSSELIITADEFIQFFSTEDKSIHIDLNILVQKYIQISKHFAVNIIVLLFASICFEKTTCSKETLEDTINKIVSYYRHIFRCFSLGAIKENLYINFSRSLFYKELSNGIYTPSLSHVRLHDKYEQLFINIIRYALGVEFTDIRELFCNDDVIPLFNKFDSIIIAPEVYQNRLFLRADNKYFVKYLYRENNKSYLDDNYLDYEYVYKLKNPLLFDKLKEIVSFFNFKKSRFLCDTDGNIYFYYYTNHDDITVYDYLRKYKLDIPDFLIDFCKLRNVATNIRFKNNFDLTSLIYFDVKNKNIYCNLFELCIEEDNNSILFSLPLLIMQTIREINLRLKDQYSYSGIYHLNVIKRLSPKFTAKLVDYLNTGEYDYNDDTLLIEELKNTISTNYNANIEFIEDIYTKDQRFLRTDINDDEFLSKLDFIDDTYADKFLNDIGLDKFNKYKKSRQENGCVDLISIFMDSSTISLNNETIKKLLTFNKLPTSSYTAYINKIIVSYDMVENNGYKIIGFVYNKHSLFSAIEYIKSGRLTIQQVYTIIYQWLLLYEKHWLDVPSLPSKSILLEKSKNEYSCVVTDFKSNMHSTTPNYYNKIIDWLNIVADFEKNYQKFNYHTFMPKMCIDLSTFYDNVSKITFCEEHSLYHLKGKLCLKCKKLYYPIGHMDTLLAHYDSNYSFSNLYNHNGSKKNSLVYESRLLNYEQVKLGIEHDLYNKFGKLIPKKIAISNKFDTASTSEKMGILYDYCDMSKVIELSTLKNAQRLKAVLVLYKQLLPHILDQTFISSNITIFKTIVMHQEYKGEILIPNLSLLDCQTILSFDENLKSQKATQTKELFAQFLTEYILEDGLFAQYAKENTVEIISILNDIKECKFTEKPIRDFLSLYKKYCIAHKIYFSSKENICPCCITDGIVASKVRIENKSYFDSLAKQTPDYDGGEANLYNYNTNMVQKIFKDNADLNFKSKILGKAIEKKPLINKFNKKHSDIRIISVSEILYMLNNDVLTLKGFTQPFIQDAFKISCFKDKSFVKEKGYTRKDIVDIIIKVCKGIEFIHSIGGFIGDLNGGNILVRDKNVYIIDIDGMSFDEVKNCMYTNMYIYPPSVENNNISKEDDWYSIAIQAFYYLTYSHPFKGISSSSNVPDNEVERMKLGLSVLGNHKITPPSISIGWDFMPKYLIEFFLKTFEGTQRISMLEVLQSYYSYLEKNELKFTAINRQYNVACNINEYTYIDIDNNLIFKEKVLTNISGWTNFISYDNGYSLIGLSNFSYVLNESNGNLIRFNKTYYFDSPTYICNDTIYYTSNDNTTLLCDNVIPESGEVSTHTIRRNTYNIILSLCVIEQDKIVYVEKNDDSSCYDIYCNSINVCSIKKKRFSTTPTIDILYDTVFKKWLVIFATDSHSIGVIIEREKENYTLFELNETLSNSKYFYGNVLYYVDANKICYFNVNTHNLKYWDCDVADMNSSICRQGNKFVILNNSSAYMYTKP